jgi:hypothetical protein
LWDRNVVNLQVVDATEKTIQIRVLVSARNAGEAWDLRCEMREKLIAILQKEMPQALPKLRLEDDGRRDPASPRASTRAEAH